MAGGWILYIQYVQLILLIPKDLDVTSSNCNVNMKFDFDF